ncbi:tetratricopeptide repeat protein [Moorellaceae bacterium AZ2]
MGFMSSLRRLGRRRPALGIALTAVLVVGLLAGYIVWTPASGISPRAEEQGADMAKQMEEWQKAVRDQINQREAEIAELEKQLEDKPQDADLWLKLGDTRYAVGSLYLLTDTDADKAEGAFKGAMESYEKVQELNPGEKGIYLRIAKTAVFLGDNDRAEANYRQAVAADPADNGARMSYAMFLAMAKSDYKGAIAQWQEILQNNPEPELADQVRELIKQAEERSKEETPASEGKE